MEIREVMGMKEKGFMYEARGQVLVIHLPKELDHHNCRDLRRIFCWRRIM